MSDDAKSKTDAGLDWGEELESWELDIEDHSAAESSPLPDAEGTGEHTVVQTPMVPAPVNDNDHEDSGRITKVQVAPPPPPPEAFAPKPAPVRPSAESGSLERRMYKPPSPEEVAALERSLQKTMPPPSTALEGDSPYTELAPIPIEVLDAISHAQPLAVTMPPSAHLYGQGETVRPFSPLVAHVPETQRAPSEPDFAHAIPTPVVQSGEPQAIEDAMPPIDRVGDDTLIGEAPGETARVSQPGTLEVLDSSEHMLESDEHPLSPNEPLLSSAGPTPSDDEDLLDATHVEPRPPLEPVHAPIVETPERAEVRRRIARLEALARRHADNGAEELLISGAELAEGIGDVATAESLYERALAEAPRRAPALQALIRLAFRNGDMARYALLLERLSELPLPRLERTRVLTTLALTRWAVEHDVPGALGAATEAQRLSPEQLAPNLLVARIEASSHPAKIDATLVPLALRTQDLGLASLWLVTAARALEVRGELEEARTLYSRAAADDPFAFDAQFSLSRMNHALGAHAEAARALLQTLESFDIGPVAEAVRRRAAHMLGVQGAHADAVELLEHASDDVSLRTAAQVALASDDAALKLRAVEGWSSGTDGVERALALITQAELLAEAGRAEDADEALQQAALADPSSSLVRVRREALARSSGNGARLAEIASSEVAGRGALTAAAQLAFTQRDQEEELRWLEEAASQEAGIGAHLLAIDASAELGRDEQQRALLRAEAERGEAHQQALALLALSELERKRGENDVRRDLLEQAVELSPRDVSLLRAFARAGAGNDEAAAQVYRREGELVEGVSSAFAHLREGFALPAGSAPRLDAFAAAYAAAPDYLPTTWALHREARRQGDLARLSELHTGEAERASTPEARASHLVRAALIRAGEDTAAAAQQLTRALELMPQDPVLAELVLRLGDVADPAVRAGALDRMAARAEPPFRRQLVIAAAGTFEDAGRLSEAAERYRSVLAETPNDPIAEAGLERVTVEADRGHALIEAKRRAVQDASTERTRARALEELLLLETDPKQALEIAHELFVLSPTHPLALRALERDAMTRDDRAALISLTERALESCKGPRDKAARMRFVQLLRWLAPEDEAARAEDDRKLVERADDARHSLWLARQLTGAAVALDARDALVHTLALAAEQTQDSVERASLIIQRGWLTLGNDPEKLLAELDDALQTYPEHPTGLELLAEAKNAAGRHESAADQFEHAAIKALGDERAAYLWARAAELWDKQLKQPARAKKALQKSAARDLDQPAVRERLESLLTEQGDTEGLIAFTAARIAQTTPSAPPSALRAKSTPPDASNAKTLPPDAPEGSLDAPALPSGAPDPRIELYRKLSALEEQRDDRSAARLALRSALDLDADNLPVWRDLAKLGERAKNHPERVEGLSAVVRLSRDPLELRDALLELGSVYENDIGDATRAEAAYQRVLKLGPRNTKAMERLARLYRANGQVEQATDMLTQLAQNATEPRQRRDVTLQLVTWKEEQGDVRAAEELLESLRRAQPTDALVLRALTALLRRTNAHVALAMHLNRAVNDLRQALTTRFDDPELWLALVAVLVERGRLEVASQCAATAMALGVHAPELEKEERSDAEREGIGAAALSELLDDLVFPEKAPAGLRIVFRHAAEALNRTVPLDLAALGAEKLDKRHPLRNIIAEQARWVSHRDIDVFVSAELPYAFVPIQDSPVQLLVGKALIDSLSEHEQRFLVARALKIARAQMSIVCRLPPQQMELLLHALVRNQVVSHAPPFLELGALDDAARRLGKQLSRRTASDLVPTLLELTYAGVPRFDAANVYGIASEAGTRAGLLATGNIDAALSALIKLSGMALEKAGPAARVAQVEEARELVSFAISDAYFEARMRAGKEPR